jgi:membrane-associated phospholipid phosphatase
MLPTQATELNWIAAFQGDGELRRVMIWFSYLGSGAFTYALPFTYFVLSRKGGLRLYLLFSISNPLQEMLKGALHLPRPYWVDRRIKGLSTSASYGMPSGHVLAASVGWPLIAQSIRKPWVWLFALAAVLAVSVSRVYLGVHFISDVVVAWLIATGLICSFGWLERGSWKWVASVGAGWLIGIAFGVTLALLALGAWTNQLNAVRANPPEWSVFAENRHGLNGLFGSSGEFFGAACGAIMAGRWARFNVRGPLWRRGISLAWAMAGAWLLRQFYKLAPTPDSGYLQLPLEFFRGAIGTFWTLFPAPWILLKSNVLSPEEAEPHGVVPLSCIRPLKNESKPVH